MVSKKALVALASLSAGLYGGCVGLGKYLAAKNSRVDSHGATVAEAGWDLSYADFSVIGMGDEVACILGNTRSLMKVESLIDVYCDGLVDAVSYFNVITKGESTLYWEPSREEFFMEADERYARLLKEHKFLEKIGRYLGETI